MSLTTDQGKAVTAILRRLDQLESERDRLEAAIDRHRADMLADGSRLASIDEDLYAALRKIRDERDAAPGGRDEEGGTEDA